MGKVRTRIESDIEALAHWVGRKIRNHQPMTSRDKGGRNTVKVFVNPVDHTDVRYCLRDGRQFKITLTEAIGDEVLAEGVPIVA